MSWSFDGIYRLTGETVTNDTQYNGSVSYGLDPVGNRLSASSSLHGISSAGFSYNADDQILGETYDANGNTTATGGKTFAYDSENQLVSMNGAAVTMVYDGDGNRVLKTANGVTTRDLVDDLNPTGYSQVVEEIANGAANREYTYGLQRIDEDQIVNNAWTPSFYGYDGRSASTPAASSASTKTRSSTTPGAHAQGTPGSPHSKQKTPLNPQFQCSPPPALPQKYCRQSHFGTHSAPRWSARFTPQQAEDSLTGGHVQRFDSVPQSTVLSPESTGPFREKWPFLSSPAVSEPFGTTGKPRTPVRTQT